MTIEIDNDVLLTNKRRQAKWQSFPFEQLEVGQSFHIKLDEFEENKTIQEASKELSVMAIHAAKRLAPRKFSLRTVGEDDKRGIGIRVWRQADRIPSLDSLFEGEEAQESPEPVTEAVQAPKLKKPKPRAQQAPVGSPTQRRRHARQAVQQSQATH